MSLTARAADLGGGLRSLLDVDGFPARWNCGRWSFSLGWLHIVSDLVIFAAYLSIPLALAYFLIRRRDFPYPWLTALFAAFILSCGIGHALEALIFWHPVYRLAGVMKAITAVISWATVIAVIRILPRSLELPGIARLNLQLQGEIANRLLAEQELRRGSAESRKLALVASCTDNAVILTDSLGRVEWVNEGFTRITGYSPEEAIGRSPGSLLQGPGTDRATDEFMRERQRQGEGFLAEVLNYAKDGREYWLSIEVRPIHDEGGRLVHFMAIEADVTERKRAEAEVRDLNARLEQRLLRLDALHQVDLAIASSLDIHLILGIVLDQVRTQLRVDAAAVLLFDPNEQALAHGSSRGFRTDEIYASRLRLGEGHAGRAALEHRTVSIPDLSDISEPFLCPTLVEAEGFAAYFAVPLVAKGQVQGVLEVYHRGVLEPDPEWTAFLETLAGQAAVAIDNVSLFRDLQRALASLTLSYDATIEGWAKALDLRDKETEGHTRRVTEMSVRLAREMGIEGAELVQIRRGALLHDIGKLGIPDAILLKPGKLTDGEWGVMRRHPGYALEWLSPVAFLRPALDIPYCHHEKWDGTGYPRGLAGEQIPASARLFAAVDVWDALRSDRPYRVGWAEGRVVEHLRSLAGTHLDPAVVKAFLRLLTGLGPGSSPAAQTGAPVDGTSPVMSRASASGLP
jgi:PAS domain S-box-containing protein